MTIHVKFFASLRESLNTAGATLTLTGDITVAQVWQQATDNQPLTESILCAINHQHAEFDSVVADGDEVAFFPPVTGG